VTELNQTDNAKKFLYPIGQLLQWKENHYGKIIFPNCRSAAKDDTQAELTLPEDEPIISTMASSIISYCVPYKAVLDYSLAGFTDADVEKHGPPGFGTNNYGEGLKLFFDHNDSPCNISLIILRQHNVGATTKTAIKIFSKNYYLCLINKKRTNCYVWVDEQHIEPHSFITDRQTLLKQKCLNSLRVKKQKYSTK
jgi:hypothetical protein